MKRLQPLTEPQRRSHRTPSLDQSQRAAAATACSSSVASAIHQGGTVALARNTGGRLNNTVQFITVSIISRAGRLIFHLQPGQFTSVHFLATGPFFFVSTPCHRTQGHYLSHTPTHTHSHTHRPSLQSPCTINVTQKKEEKKSQISTFFSSG